MCPFVVAAPSYGVGQSRQRVERGDVLRPVEPRQLVEERPIGVGGRPGLAQLQQQPAVLGHRTDRLRGIGTAGGNRGRQGLLRKRASRRLVAGSAQGTGQFEHRVERVRMGRSEDAPAAVDPFGKDLARPGVVLHGDEHASEVRHRPQGQGVLRTEDAALDVEKLLERGPGRGVVAQGSVGQAQVVEGAESGGVVLAKGVAPAVVDALVHRPRRLRLIHERESDGQTVDGGQRVQVARAEHALAALHEDGVGVAGDEIFLELERDCGKSRLDLDRGRMVRPKKLAASLQHLPANRPLGPGIIYSFEQDAEILQRRQTGNCSSRAAGCRAIHRQSEFSCEPVWRQ